MVTEVQIIAANQSISKHVAETLDKHYPGHMWAVHCDIEQGIVSIKNLNLSGQWGFYLKIADLENDPKMKITIRAGGELLERYSISRGKYNENEFHGRKTDLMGGLAI